MNLKGSTTLFLLLSLMIPVLNWSQSITGYVTDGETKEAMIGVSVLNKYTTYGAITDYNGQFRVQASQHDTLIFKYIGYKTLEYPVNNTSVPMDIQLYTDLKLLDEVVVIGYGTIKKSDLTGAVSSVKSSDIIKVPAANAIQSLQGKVSGLQIMSTSGDPGATPVVRLRGITTLNNNNPIAVIDGVITEVSAISLLNANDIESIEVLKDASAAAIYGSRGAAGVIIVTTKKGNIGKNTVQVSIERSAESIAHRIDVMTGKEFATYLNRINPGQYNNLDALPNIDWQNLIFKNNAPLLNANFSVSGGSDQTTYYLGLGYFDQKGIISKSGLKRYTAKINSGYKISSAIHLGLDLSMSYGQKDNTPDVISTALRAWPINKPFKVDSSFADVNGGNALAAIEYSNSHTNNLRSLGNLFATYKPIRGLTLKSSFQFEVEEYKAKSFSPKYFVGPLQQNEENDLNYTTGNNTSFILENTITYDKSIGKHNFNVLAGYSAQDIKGEFLSGSTEGLIRENKLFWFLDAGLDVSERTGNNFGRSTLLSTLGRINYTYDSRYLFTASYRRDGSSKFGPLNKYGVFPSFAVGWNITNESFFPKSLPVNRAKLRASWGIIGNEKINGNAQYSLITTGSNAVFGQKEAINAGASFNGGGNPNLKWEETHQSNIGLDLGVFDDRWVIELDYYVKKTNDILVPLAPIGYTGIGSFRTIIFNAAEVENKGFEWNVSYRNSWRKINYQLGLLGTTIKNKVTNIGQGIGADSLLVGGDLGNGQQVARSTVGLPIGFHYGYQAIGIFQNEAELSAGPTVFGQEVGDLRFKDINGDGKLDSKDRTIIGSSIPDLIFGFNAQVGYKNINLAADFQGQLGNEIYNGKQVIRFATLNYEEKFNHYWQGQGTTNIHPKPSLGGPNFLPSSYFIEDGSFLRLRSLTLNYTLPDILTNKLKSESFNIYARATNLFTATRFTGYSPEIGAASAVDGVIDRGVYPITRTFSIGVNAKF